MEAIEEDASPLDTLNKLNAVWQQIIGKLKKRVKLQQLPLVTFLVKNIGIIREIAQLTYYRFTTSQFEAASGDRYRRAATAARRSTGWEILLPNGESVTFDDNVEGLCETLLEAPGLIPSCDWKDVQLLHLPYIATVGPAVQYLLEHGYPGLRFDKAFRMAIHIASTEPRGFVAIPLSTYEQREEICLVVTKQRRNHTHIIALTQKDADSHGARLFTYVVSAEDEPAREEDKR